MLLDNVYSDTLFATTVSRRGNMCMQTFATIFAWSVTLISNEAESEAHEALSFLFQLYGVLPAIV